MVSVASTQTLVTNMANSETKEESDFKVFNQFGRNAKLKTKQIFTSYKTH